jgi:AcrR family transcriptional regulator
MATTPSRRKTRAEKQAETRRRLLDAGEIVFRRCGLHGASIEAITEEAGFTRGAFYSNFKDKNELFIALLHDRVYTGFRQLLESLSDQSESPLEQLRHGATQLARRYEDKDGRWLFELWLEILARAARDEEFAGVAATFWTGNRKLIAEMARANTQTLGSELPIEAEHLATAQIALDIGLAVQHLVDPESVPLDLYPTLFELLFGRFVTPQPDE